MDGFQPLVSYCFGRAEPSVRRRTEGGLRVRDFDAPVAADTTSAELDQAQLEQAERTAMLNAARAEGHALGRAEAGELATASQAAQQVAALQAVAAALETGSVAAAEAVVEASDMLARLLLAALDAALPAASAKLAAETATMLAITLRPLLENGQALTLAVAVGFGTACAAAIDDARITVTEDAALAPGDARADWRGGSAMMELARQRIMVAEVLHALGLQGQ